MIKQACAQIPAGTRIKKLKIVVGEASGHDAHHIESHFAEAARATQADGAVLEFIHEKLAAKCAACGMEYASGTLALACTQCGGTALVITAGNTVRLVGVETAS